MPLAFARREVDGDDAFAEQSRARPMAAVVVARRQFDRQIHEAEILVDRHLRPHARVAGVDPRFFFPRVDAEFAELRDGVENPEPLAGAHVEAAHVAFFVLIALG